MDHFDSDEISEPELQLLANFLSHVHDSHFETVADVLTTEDVGGKEPFGAGLPDVLHYVSDSVSTIDRQVLRFDDMRRSLEEMNAESPSDIHLPDGADVTPEKLHWIAIRSELTTYYSHAGVLIEDLSAELLFDSVVDEDRQSNRVKNDIENKSQWERGWLLFITGVIDSGEWDAVRDTYKRRSNFVHDSVDEEELANRDVESEIIEAWESVNLLHEKLYGLEMEHRISEQILGHEF
jgi:hypothetical protein